MEINKRKLVEANENFNNRNYSKALEIYREVASRHSEIKHLIKFNIDACERKIKQSSLEECIRPTNVSKVIFTIVARNYLHYAITLMDSINEKNDKYKLYIVLVDNKDGVGNINHEIIESSEIGIENLIDMCLRYDIMELSTAIKPFAFRHFFKNDNVEQVIYLDPDIKVYSKLERIEKIHSNDFDCIITPHITKPYQDTNEPSDHTIIKSGVYNLGFVSFKKTEPTKKYLDWWANKLINKAKSEIHNNLFTDQRWCDLIPSFIEKTYILRDPGYNVAYWNMHERNVKKINNIYYSNEEELVFFHFSGVNARDNSIVSKHQTRFKMEDLNLDVRDLFNEYRELLLKNKFDIYSKLACSTENLGDGVKMNKLMHDFYSHVRPESIIIKNNDLSSYFLSVANSVYKAYKETNFVITELMYYIYSIRKDVQEIYDIEDKNDHVKIKEWFRNSFKNEYKIDARFAEYFENRSVYKLAVENEDSKNNCLNLTNLVILLAKYRKDLNEKFDLNTRNGAEDYNEWLVRRLPIEYGANYNKCALSQKNVIDKFHGTDEVNIIGYLKGEFGLGERARRSCEAFEAAGIKVNAINYDFGYKSRQKTKLQFELKEVNNGIINLFHINADQLLNVYLNKGLDFFIGKYNIAYFAWELDECPSHWGLIMNLVDEIWVPSEFVKRSFEKITGKPIIVINEPIYIEEKYNAISNKYKSNSNFTFLVTFDCNSYIHRKNPFASIEAFKRAFPKINTVKLLVKVMNGSDESEEYKKLCDLTCADKRIELINEVIDEADYHQLINSIDVLISLHRAEGFGRCPAEAMWMGKPVVLTGYSGVLEYANSENACLVNYELVDINPDEYPYSDGLKWAEPNIYQAADYLRRLYFDKDYYLEKSSKSKSVTRNKLSVRAIGNKYKQRISKIGLIN